MTDATYIRRLALWLAEFLFVSLILVATAPFWVPCWMMLLIGKAGGAGIDGLGSLLSSLGVERTINAIRKKREALEPMKKERNHG